MTDFYRNVKYPLWTQSAYSLDCRACFQRKAREARRRDPEKSRDANRRAYEKRLKLASDDYCLKTFRMTASDAAKYREARKVRLVQERERNLNIRQCRASFPRREGPTWVERKIQDWKRQKLAKSVAAALAALDDGDSAAPSRDYQAQLLADRSLTPMERLEKLRAFNSQRRED
ncbi:hypothetical protein [Paraburkholderia strydomiana]